MPELPEAETMARDLNSRVADQTISEVLVSFDKIVASDLSTFAPTLIGQKIERVGRIGKWIKFDLSSGGALLAHLKMTGQFVMGDWPGDLSGEWPAHTRAAFLLTGENSRQTLFYRDIRKFGRLRAFSPDGLRDFLKELGLGPDPLKLEPADFHSIVSGKKARLKQVLLDQGVIAGLGNIYVDESLFAAALSPFRLATTLSPEETSNLLTQIQRVLAKAIELRGSTVENYQGLEGPGSFQDHHLVYGKHGQNCPKCGEGLAKGRVGGRGTTYCPACQK
ncbi:MAG: bifunctional DNA-formamidopyrimidine glycosylase/DNA-(apurinic or apyrimidinic site) lyase [Deltaproteobacteria bacterium]|jgi:formamidopyrimidine-DNA glycosylase|nr:bifunctional DNA-formamidopyrimidine glycosylase/DNA-(apurinic or apyrimidinic site) lyase [Deltaproteobacteria bacterium]